MSNEEWQAPLLWPRYIERTWLERTLCYFQTGSIVTEHNAHYTINDITDFIQCIFTNNLLTFIDNFLTFPYTNDLTTLGELTCNSLGVPLAACLTGAKRTTRWVLPARGWSYVAVGPGMLTAIRATFEHAGVGTPNTPGALGQKLMRASYKETYGQAWRDHRHKRPSGNACKEIDNHASGARADVAVESTDVFPLAWELDQKNAYLAAAGSLPTGDTIRVLDGPDDDMCTYFAECTITIKNELVLGPFPVRIEDEKNGLHPVYPRAPGMYTAWLWQEEVERCQAAGCLVRIGDGFGWEEWTNDLQPWIEKMSRLRDTAPNPEVEGFMKLAIVAGLGRFGMVEGRQILIPEDQADIEKDTPVAVGGLAYDWYVKKIPEWHPTTMPHWYRYIMMKCRIMLYDLALPYAKQELLIGTNTDAILVKDGADIAAFKRKDEPALTGEYRKRPLTRVTVPHLRHLISNEKVTRPGVPRKNR